MRSSGLVSYFFFQPPAKDSDRRKLPAVHLTAQAGSSAPPMATYANVHNDKEDDPGHPNPQQSSQLQTQHSSGRQFAPGQV